jgi:ABC-type Fe3+-siderophore transport system, permease component
MAKPDSKPAAPRRGSPWIIGLLACLAVLGLALISLASGYITFSLSEIVSILSGSTSVESRAMIILDVRLPRIATAILSGAALGLSGAVFQGLLLNPLADPYTLGVSSGAAFGAALVILGGMLLPEAVFLSTPWAITAGAFVAACLTLGSVVTLGRGRDGRLLPTNLILAGVIISAILSAAISFIKYLSGDQVGSIVFWLLGSFQARTWLDAGVILVFLVPAAVTCLIYAVDINIMTMGVRTAETLGVNTARVRLILLAAASLAAAAAVSVAGVIGFVGLIVPHFVRMGTGPDHRSLVPLSALAGALLLLAADTLVRVVLPGEIPVGVLTALLAGPVFLVLFKKKMTAYGNE